jgi:hypothetical protein
MELGFRYGGNAQVVNAQIRISSRVLFLAALASWVRDLGANNTAVERLGNAIEIIVEKIVGFPELCSPCQATVPDTLPGWGVPTSAQVGVFTALLILIRLW